MREAEGKISALKNEKFRQLTKPCDAFITFEEEDGSIIAQEFEPEFTFSGSKLPAKKKFLGDDLFFVEATEPTNVIWENRHWTTTDLAKRSFVAFAVIAGLLGLSLLIIYYCEMYYIEVQSKYEDVDCTYISEVYRI